ncbi:MAG: hypothetical protein Q7R72_02535 [bacterium]|nr:hypothetical protein [bacterium]
MKKFLFVLMFIQVFVVAVGFLWYLGISKLPQIERQTFSILINAKEILLVALYIAWCVTPPTYTTTIVTPRR